ncbi:hypothetical protein VFMJ11_A0719 [Aliivibrio fischeri MJ11]|uniref:Uncharacterized protein n=1 Tax=Aliivibrio fischeri (strain MJ11) TaxID=388396 RepID=B5EUA0_ALIFM|nr:hypothetical protein VFMJ11_A0719 [Aliivibrio fischeri MJ11]
MKRKNASETPELRPKIVNCRTCEMKIKGNKEEGKPPYFHI